jgi:hypothetical protein
MMLLWALGLSGLFVAAWAPRIFIGVGLAQSAALFGLTGVFIAAFVISLDTTIVNHVRRISFASLARGR